MPETTSRDAQPGTSRRFFAGKAVRLMVIATSMALMLPTCDYARRRSARLHDIAGVHLRECVSGYSRAEDMKSRGIPASRCDRVIRIADHHLSMVEKYSQAARHPWLPVAADPPEPG